MREDGIVRVLPDQSFQTMRAWEATAFVGTLDRDMPEVRAEVLDSAAELGINRLRVEVRSGAEQPIDNWSRWQADDLEYARWRCSRYATVNDNEDPGVIDWAGFQFSELDHKVETVVLPFAERLRRRGEELQLNLNYVAFTGQICDGEYIHADRPEEYAEFALAVHIHLRDKYGLVPDSWEMILEPDNYTDWTPGKLVEAIVVTGRVLEENGFNARLIAPSTMSMGKGLDWLKPILDRPDARRYLWEVAYHRYRDTGLEFAERYGSLVADGLPTAMLEHIPAEHTTLYTDLTVSQVSSWQQYVLGGFFQIDEPTEGVFVVRSHFRTPYLRPFMRNVRPGAIRIGTEVTHASHRAVAFVNVDGRHVVGMLHRHSGTVLVEGLVPGEYRVIRVNAWGTTEEIIPVEGSTEVIVEGSGVMVMVEDPPS